MSFPLHVGDRTVDSAPELATLAQSDADGPGGTVIPGKRPCEWVLDLVRDATLERRLAIGLCAALLQHADPATVSEGARLAMALHPSPLGELVLQALQMHDTGLLLHVDPGDPDRSVEDCLLRAAVGLADLTEEAVRTPLLTRLRNAGLPEFEAQVLLRYGGVEELRRWLPALLSEGLSESAQVMVRARIGTDDEGARWLAGRHVV